MSVCVCVCSSVGGCKWVRACLCACASAALGINYSLELETGSKVEKGTAEEKRMSRFEISSLSFWQPTTTFNRGFSALGVLEKRNS